MKTFPLKSLGFPIAFLSHSHSSGPGLHHLTPNYCNSSFLSSLDLLPLFLPLSLSSHRFPAQKEQLCPSSQAPNPNSSHSSRELPLAAIHSLFFLPWTNPNQCTTSSAAAQKFPGFLSNQEICYSACSSKLRAVLFIANYF